MRLSLLFSCELQASAPVGHRVLRQCNCIVVLCFVNLHLVLVVVGCSVATTGFGLSPRVRHHHDSINVILCTHAGAGLEISPPSSLAIRRRHRRVPSCSFKRSEIILMAHAAGPAFRESEESVVTHSSVVVRLLHMVVACPSSGP